MRMLVLGGAVSGTAAARLAQRLGWAVTVYDEDHAVAPRLLVDGIAAETGGWSSDLLHGVDVVVVSPGIPERARPVVESLEWGVPLWSELEFASRHLEATVVAVTGTNGKTTVTSLTADMLVRSGIAAVAAGNIGNALSDVVGSEVEVVVAEASSFQLRFIETFHPHVAVLLNIAPDHLDWHGTIDAYTSAKARIFEHHGPSDVLVFDADDERAAALAARAPGRRIPVSGLRRPDAGWGVEGAWLVVGEMRVPLDELQIGDPAYLVDIAAAATAAFEAGGTVEGVSEAIRRFTPGAHRRSLVGEWDGVRWVDDSKATNPHAALAAVRAYPSVVLVAGGRNKGLDLAPLATAHGVRRVVAIGEAAAELVAAGGTEHVVVADSMEEAVAVADTLARSGDVVLLAPGCASFDMFDSYAHRGNAFAEAVRERKAV